MSTTKKLALLTCLYFSQGLPFGFFRQAMPAVMREQGMSLNEIGMASLLALPWALKFLWSPFVDRYWVRGWGRRRSWILPLQIVAAIAMAALAFFDPETGGLGPVLVGFALANLLAATQDIATDGLAIDLLSHEERGIGNGVQVAGYRVGMIVGGGALLISFSMLGWQSTFFVMGALLVVASVPIALHREPRRVDAAALPSSEAIFGRFLSRHGALWWLLVLVAYKFFDAIPVAMLTPMLVDQGMTLEDIGLLLGTAGFVAGLAGALFGGWGASRFGRKPALIVFGVFQALALLLYLWPAMGHTDRLLVYTACIVEHFAGGTATAALFTMMMDASNPDTGGSDYTIQASIVVVATLGAASVSGFVTELFGYGGMVLSCSLIHLAAVVLVAVILGTGRVKRLFELGLVPARAA